MAGKELMEHQILYCKGKKCYRNRGEARVVAKAINTRKRHWIHTEYDPKEELIKTIWVGLIGIIIFAVAFGLLWWKT
jgi:hypothetical protein